MLMPADEVSTENYLSSLNDWVDDHRYLLPDHFPIPIHVDLVGDVTTLRDVFRSRGADLLLPEMMSIALVAGINTCLKNPDDSLKAVSDYFLSDDKEVSNG